MVGSPPVVSNVANLLGMSTDDLMTSLKSGSSMSDLASQKGVSRDDLLAAITQGLQADQSAASTGQSGQSSALAGKIADQKGLPGHHHHHHGGGSPSSSSTDLQQNVADLSAALGISSDQLVSALQSGLAGTAGTSGSGYGVSLAPPGPAGRPTGVVPTGVVQGIGRGVSRRRRGRAWPPTPRLSGARP